MTETVERFPADVELLAQIGPEKSAAFEKFMADLDAEHVRQNSPYGRGSLWQITGAECWFAFFDDGMSPGEALSEDMSASYD